MKQHEVMVVGGGVVGATLALGLHRAGVDVALIERGQRPPAFNATDYDFRVYAISPSSEQLLKRLGVWDAIAARRISPYAGMCVWDEQPEQSLRFSAASLGVARLGHIVESSLLLDALWAGLSRVPCYLGAAVQEVDFAESAARVTLDNGQQLSTRLVVAAEGRQSPLRELANIECQQWDYPQQAIVCNVVTEHAHQHTAWQRFLPDGPLAFLPLADGRSSIVWSTRRAAELMALDDASFLNQLSDAIQHRLGRVTATTHRVSFSLGLLYAQEMARARLALVGDAAHVVHPLAGQGVNLGLADAVALIETVTTAQSQRRDIGGLRVLQRYARARKADALDMLAVTEGLYRAYGTGLSSWSELRQLGLDAANRLPLFKNLLMRRAMG